MSARPSSTAIWVASSAGRGRTSGSGRRAGPCAPGPAGARGSRRRARAARRRRAAPRPASRGDRPGLPPPCPPPCPPPPPPPLRPRPPRRRRRAGRGGAALLRRPGRSARRSAAGPERDGCRRSGACGRRLPPAVGRRTRARSAASRILGLAFDRAVGEVVGRATVRRPRLRLRLRPPRGAAAPLLRRRGARRVGGLGVVLRRAGGRSAPRRGSRGRSAPRGRTWGSSLLMTHAPSRAAPTSHGDRQPRSGRGSSRAPSSSIHWWVLHTRPSFELAAAEGERRARRGAGRGVGSRARRRARCPLAGRADDGQGQDGGTDVVGDLCPCALG